jgi:hypothetical protein
MNRQHQLCFKSVFGNINTNSFSCILKKEAVHFSEIYKIIAVLRGITIQTSYFVYTLHSA